MPTPCFRASSNRRTRRGGLGQTLLNTSSSETRSSSWRPRTASPLTRTRTKRPTTQQHSVNQPGRTRTLYLANRKLRSRTPTPSSLQTSRLRAVSATFLPIERAAVVQLLTRSTLDSGPPRSRSLNTIGDSRLVESLRRVAGFITRIFGFLCLIPRQDTWTDCSTNYQELLGKSGSTPLGLFDFAISRSLESNIN